MPSVANSTLFPHGPLFAAPSRAIGVYENETGRTLMRKFVPAMAAALLISSVPAFAAGTPQPDSAAAGAPDQTQIENQNQTAQPSEQTADDDDIQLIIMGKTVQVQVPNPYKNPKPHLLTDAWAMRA
jgi:hypothetical protein